MEKRKLGRSNISLPPVMFGGNVFGWTADEATSFKLLDACMDAGLNAIDTADVYSVWARGHQGGESEIVIGNWLKKRGKRDDVIIATKVGSQMGSGDKGLSRAWIMKEVDASLKRLQTDVIDLYQAHRDDPGTPQEETMQAFADLVKAGKVRVLGASNFTADRLKSALEVSKAHNWPRYESLQPHYNLVERQAYEAELEPVCKAEDLGVINYYALAAGFLTGKYRSEADLGKSPRGGGVKKYLNERGFAVLKALDGIAASHKATPAQVALAWLIARPSVTAPIASATSVDQLQDIIAAAQLQLSAAEVAALDTASV
ncbi:MAG TPA: aldo/keto reductase [Acetobacteraceae bacterium]|nr:aldo/keto reductase [Acetobacteraceae bacterium]